MVTPRGRPFRLLNKKQSQKNDNFKQSTWREPSWFEHVERDFSSFQKKICKNRI